MEVFLYVKQHLLTQNKASIRGEEDDLIGSMCVYRSPDKLMCAAGCLMTDEEYKEIFEGHDWASLAGAGLVPAAHKKLIGELQHCHDEYDVSEWKARLDEIEDDIKRGFFY